MSSKVWPVVMLFGALMAAGFGTFAATHSLPTDGAVQANGGWDLTTLLNGALSATGVVVMVVGWARSKWPQAAPVIDTVESLLKKYLAPDVSPGPTPVDPVPKPIPNLDLPAWLDGFLKFAEERDVHGDVIFTLGGRVITVSIVSTETDRTVVLDVDHPVPAAVK